MNYKDFIQDIIKTRGQWGIPDTDYKEMHHIVPKAIGGKGDTKTNLFTKNSKHPNCIWLHAREHFIAHKLLAKENPNNYSLVAAWHSMCYALKKAGYSITPEDYEEARLLFSRVAQIKQRGRTLSEEAKHKISVAHKGKKISSETKEKLRQANLGKHLSQETIDKILKTKADHGKYTITKETRKQISDSKIGKHLYNNGKIEKYFADDDKIPEEFKPGQLYRSPEQYEKMAQKIRGRKRSNEFCKKMREVNLGHKINLGRITIHKDNLEKHVKPEELALYLNLGFIIGKPSISEEHRKHLGDALRGKHRDKTVLDHMRACYKQHSKAVFCIELNKVFNSYREAEVILNNGKTSHIHNCCNNKNKTCLGYHWRYATEQDLI